MRRAAIPLTLLAVAIIGTGCSSSGTAVPPPPNAVATTPGMSKEDQIKQIQNDPRLNGMERQIKIAEIQKQGGDSSSK